MRRWLWLATSFLLLAVFSFGDSAAHALGQSYVFLRVEENAVSGRFEVALGDLNRVLGSDLPIDGSATEEDVAPHLPAIRAYLDDRVSFAAGGAPLEVTLGEHELHALSFAQFVHVAFTLETAGQVPDVIDVSYDVGFEGDDDHRGMLVIEHNWKAGTLHNEANVSLIFSPSSRQQSLDLTESSMMRGFIALVELGVHHIWVGIDHILFLIALLLPSVVRRENGRWRVVESFRTAFIDVLKIVTLFTIAHSVTLSLAALGIVQIPSRLVESIIAVSIAVAAVDILFPVFRGRVWLIVFAFGLFHGFGFASVLGEMGIGDSYMVLSLLGFNIGVELGQAAIVLAVFPVLFLLRATPAYIRFVLPATASLLILVSLYWFTERALDVDLTAGALARKIVGM